MVKLFEVGILAKQPPPVLLSTQPVHVTSKGNKHVIGMITDWPLLLIGTITDWLFVIGTIIDWPLLAIQE